MAEPRRRGKGADAPSTRPYRFPLARLCVLQSIWQFFSSVAPPFKASRVATVLWRGGGIVPGRSFGICGKGRRVFYGRIKFAGALPIGR